MFKVIAVILAGLTLASCTQTERGATLGAATGAVIGGVIANDVRGAAIGAAIGGVLGAVASQPGQCYYKDEYGRKFIDDCPDDYVVRARPVRTKVVVRM
jgi:uncharacterized membrane protein